MASWKLIVEDYGKIKSAEIEVAPLTMFVGDNNSGKSYLLALLWGIEKFGVEALIGDEYVDTEEVKPLVDWLCEQIDVTVKKQKHEVSLGQMSNTLEVFLNAQLRKNKNNLVTKIFNSKSAEIGNLKIELGDLNDKIFSFELGYAQEFFQMIDDNRKGFGFNGNLVVDKSYKEQKFLIWFLIQGIYSSILNISTEESGTDESIYLPAARTGFMLTKDIINKVGRKNTFNLTEEKEAITPFIRPINQFLDIIGDLSVETFGNEKNLKLASDLENEMANGTIEFSALPNREVQYIPMGYKKSIPLRLSSAVVTELSPLILILKHKRHVERFYYEEPEMCLHPQLQNIMGKIIGRMINSGIQMVITTHSDIMLQHINNMIKLSKRDDCEEICKKLGYGEIDLLSNNQVKVYQLRTSKRGKTEVVQLKCGENGFAVPTFNDALDKIMNEAYEIQG